MYKERGLAVVTTAFHYHNFETNSYRGEKSKARGRDEGVCTVVFLGKG